MRIPLTIIALAFVPQVLAHADTSRRAAGAPTIRADGVGPVHFGMRLEAARKALKFDNDGLLQNENADEDDKHCYYAHPAGWSEKANFMIEDGIVTRFDISDSSIRTDQGLSVGMNEKTLTDALGKEAIIGPADYDDGHEFKIFKGSNFELKFKIDQETKKIEWITAGLKKSAEYMEGCL